nr:MAG TPA: hypothetical protein [Caudoviricetes sp.]
MDYRKPKSLARRQTLHDNYPNLNLRSALNWFLLEVKCVYLFHHSNQKTTCENDYLLYNKYYQR